MQRILLGLLIANLIGLGAPAFAEEAEITHANCGVCSSAAAENRFTKTGGQLTRGLSNLAFCWLELAHQPIREMRGSEFHWGQALWVGAGKGAGHTLLRGVKGLGEILTAPLPHARDGSQIADDCPLCMWTR